MAYYGVSSPRFSTSLSGPGSKRQPPVLRFLALLQFTEQSGEKRTYVPSNSGPRVFVVDDEHVIASTLAAILKLHGYSATFFTSPREALAAARSKAPDLLVSDVAMPDISGIDLAIQMKAQYPNCKILLFSGQASTQDLLEDARRQGYNFQLLPKPVHPSAIVSTIGALTGESDGSDPIPVFTASEAS
jgi:CheY-like chemotaxis protein